MAEAVELPVKAIPRRWLRRLIGQLPGWFRGRGLGAPRRLRLCETLSLGEKRFLAVIEVEGQKLLISGTPNSLALLAELPNEIHIQGTASEVQPVRLSWKV